MNREAYRSLGVAIIFALMILGVIANTGVNLVRDMFIPKPVVISEEKADLTPAVVVPTPNKGYFVECMMGDFAIVTADDNVYYYWCNRGKWEITDDKDHRDYKLPEPQEHDTGAI